MKKLTALSILILILSLASTLRVKAAYNYNPLGDVIASAEALISSKVVDSSNILNVDGDNENIQFGELVDVTSYENRIFVVDRSNSAIYVLDNQYNYIDTFGNEGLGKLDTPQGIFVTDEFIYVADSKNQRVAIYDHQLTYVREIGTPDDPTFKQFPEDKGYEFRPLKVTVDRTGRVYVIAAQIFEGIIDFNPDGTFSRYVGANTVTLSVWDAFWLNFTTEEQRKAQGYRLATTFVNLNIDKKGYLYTVSSSTEGSRVIKKLNNKGEDVLTRNGYFPPAGDVWTISGNVNVPTGSSELIDIEVNEYGTYSVLDKTRGRIFTYDFEGNLLYIGGQLGNVGGAKNNQSSLFLSPEALCYHDNKILVVDSMNKNIVVLEYTEFATLVNQATNYYFEGDYISASKIWEDVLVLNTNYYLAYAGIGKAQLRDGNYQDAMVNLKLGYDDYNYSKAYKQYRYDKLTIVFPYFLGVGIVTVVYLFGRSIKKSVLAEKEDEKNG